MTTTLYIERDDKEIAVEVELDYSRASRGKRDRYGVPMEPDYEASINFIGCDVDLTKAEIDRAIEQAWEELNDARNQF